jgi:hypothetical protein
MHKGCSKSMWLGQDRWQQNRDCRFAAMTIWVVAQIGGPLMFQNEEETTYIRGGEG